MAGSSRPETLNQAEIFDAVVAAYMAAGWCPICSAQAAFGRQIGFRQVQPPCPSCRGLQPPHGFSNDRSRSWAAGKDHKDDPS